MVMLPAAIGAGAIVGFTLGLIGGGGSILATPLLLYGVGVRDPHLAIGTGALAVAVNAYISFFIHARQGHVWWRCAMVFALVGTLGAMLGSSLGMWVDGRRLVFLFGLLMIVVALLMLRPRSCPAPPAYPRPLTLRICLLTTAAAMATGMASGFFGIGGGFLIVPALMLATGMPMLSAIGSSLLAVGSFGLATALNYGRSGWVDGALAGQFIAGGILGSWLGMRLATRLSARKQILNRIFAVLVLGVAGYVLARNMPSC